MDKNKKKLIRQYYATARLLGLMEDFMAAIKESYGVKHMNELSCSELLEIINKLDGEANLWRRRVMAAIGAYLRRYLYNENTEIIKAIACRATGYKEFNYIPISRLRSLYNEFRNQNNIAECINYEISKIELTIAQKN